MRVILAPMQGLADDVLRAVLTRFGGYDWCVSEFVRVSGTLLPPRFFQRLAPELHHGARTEAGTPLRLQLLGSDPHCMAENAARAAELDPFGIDLNFGCPAPCVNRHRGGAALLEEPELLHAITAAVRRAVPSGLAVTAKMRLGISDTALTLDCARALVDAGASELVVHGRTKEDGYRPPARWEWIARIREAVGVPVIANGEVWTAADWQRCREVTGCQDVMLGRGAAADPLLARRLRGEFDKISDREAWSLIAPEVAEFWQRVQQKVEARHAPGRFKQWLQLLRRRYPDAETLYWQLRELRQPAAVTAAMNAHLDERGLLQPSAPAVAMRAA